MALEGDSSSPSAEPTILRIEQKGAGREQVRVDLSDGSSFFVLRHVQLQEGLFPGDRISSGRVQDVQRRSDRLSAERVALSLIARAPHTREGLRLKLSKRGLPPDATAAAMDRMAELGYLDDHRFAEEWLRMRMARHSEGRVAMLAGLLKRGIPRDIAERAVEETVSPADELRALLRAVDRYAGRYSGRRLAARLVARGFAPALVLRNLPELRGSSSGNL